MDLQAPEMLPTGSCASLRFPNWGRSGTRTSVRSLVFRKPTLYSASLADKAFHGHLDWRKDLFNLRNA